MVLNESVKKEIIAVFKECYTANQSAKDLADHAREIKSELAKQLGIKTEVVNTAFSNWVRTIEKPELVQEADLIVESIL